MKIIHTFLSVLFLTILFNSAGNAQGPIAGWDVSTQTGGTNNFGTSPLSASTTASNTIIGSLTRGTGVANTGTGASRGWGGNGFTSTTSAAAITASQFFTFTVKANSGHAVSLTAVDPYDYRRSPTGPPQALIQYSLNGINFTDITNVSFPTTATTGDHSGPISLSGVSAIQNVGSDTTITFRIVPYGASSSAGTCYIFDFGNSTADDFVITGTVAATGAPFLTFGGSLTPFSQTSASPSAEQTYTIIGSNLTNDVTVTPPAGD